LGAFEKIGDKQKLWNSNILVAFVFLGGELTVFLERGTGQGLSMIPY